MSVEDRFSDILSLLKAGTQSGTLMWEPMPKNEGWYAGSGTYIYTLRVQVMPDEGPKWVGLRVLDRDGNEIDATSAHEEENGFDLLSNLLSLVLAQIETRRRKHLEGVRAELRSKITA